MSDKNKATIASEEKLPTTFGITPLKRRLLSGGAWALGGRVAAALVGLATNALLARLLSPQDLGAYFLAFSVVVFGSQLGSLGLNLAVVRFVAESVGLNQHERARRVVSLTLRLGVLGALGVALAYLSFGGVLAEKIFNAPALAAVTGLVAGWIVVSTVQNLFSEIFRGFHDIRWATILGGTVFGGLFAGFLVTFCLALLLLTAERAALSTVILLAVGSGFTSALMARWLLSRKLASLRLGREESNLGLREIVRVSLPLLMTNSTLVYLTQIDVWILGAFRPQEEVAIYGAAVRAVVLVAMALQVTNSVIAPIIAEMYAQGRQRQLERTMRAVATIAGIPAFLASAGFVLFGGPVLSIVFGDYYREGAAVLAVLSLGQLANVWAGPCALTLTMTGHQGTLMRITLLSGILATVGGLWAARYYGPIGVAITMAISITTQNILMLLFAKRQTGMWTHMSLSLLRIRSVGDAVGRNRI